MDLKSQVTNKTRFILQVIALAICLYILFGKEQNYIGLAHWTLMITTIAFAVGMLDEMIVALFEGSYIGPIFVTAIVATVLCSLSYVAFLAMNWNNKETLLGTMAFSAGAIFAVSSRLKNRNDTLESGGKNE